MHLKILHNNCAILSVLFVFLHLYLIWPPLKGLLFKVSFFLNVSSIETYGLPADFIFQAIELYDVWPASRRAMLSAYKAQFLSLQFIIHVGENYQPFIDTTTR